MNKKTTDKKIEHIENEAAFIEEMARALRQKKLVLFPCENSYSIAFDYFDEASIERIYALKERPKEKKFLAFMSSMDWLDTMGIVPNDLEQEFMRQYWPGMLRIVFTENFAAGFPKTPWLHEIIKTSGILIGVTSANRSGQPVVKKASDLDQAVIDAVDKVFIDDGKNVIGEESTIVRLKGNIEILRNGNPKLGTNGTMHSSQGKPPAERSN